MHGAEIHTENIRKEPTDIAEGLVVDRAQQEGLMEILLKEVLVIPGRHLQCLEPQVIIPEEVQGLEVQVAIKVLDPGVPEAQGAIEAQGDLQDLLAACEVQEGLQDLLVACEVPVVAQEVPAVVQEVLVEAGAADNNSKNQ